MIKRHNHLFGVKPKWKGVFESVSFWICKELIMTEQTVKKTEERGIGRGRGGGGGQGRGTCTMIV